MKLTKTRLKQLIKEELAKNLQEASLTTWKQERTYDIDGRPATNLVKLVNLNPKQRVVLNPMGDEGWQWYVEEETYDPSDPDERPDWGIRANSIEREGHPFETVESAIADANDAGYKV